ncbi:bcl-2-like protein 2 isoform X1 [Argiope bruennichi]|uniref:bcl-2-like protein 2 isoform X1 n=1 Tax=Argiope bruennichi TaxID=94029 RepID=UPI00249437AB|nr:bcl-2-like protein 2 isoform X1 [Argiope bruennichi]
MADVGKSNIGTHFNSMNGDGSAIDPNVAALISDYLQYKLGQCGYQWTSPLTAYGAGNTLPPKVGTSLRALSEEFTSQFKEQFVEMCEKLSINAENMKGTLDGVANELFSEGIKWARIVALFVFGSELAIHCKNRNCLDLINIIAYSLATYITEKLLPWINDHGGWEGLVHFNDGGGIDSGPDRDKWPSLRNIICLGVSALGAITLGAVLAKS